MNDIVPQSQSTIRFGYQAPGKKGVRGFIRSKIAAGYQPTYVPPHFVEWMVCENGEAKSISKAKLKVRLASQTTDAVLIVPTMLQRGNASEQVERLETILQQAAAADGRISVVWGLQGDVQEALQDRMQEVARIVHIPEGVTLINLILSKGRKTDTLNLSFDLFSESDYRIAGWIDDDVVLSDRCIPDLFERMKERGFAGAIGPEKRAVKGDNTASRWLYNVKNITMPATNYPHGCCIFVERSVVERGIPTRHTSDDGYVCFSLMERNIHDVAGSLEVYHGPWCEYVVGAPKGTNRKRIKRLLIHHWVFLCDYSFPVARYYWSHMLFAGFWPLGKTDLSNGVSFAIKKWALKLIYFAILLSVGVELFCRGLLNRPIREISWGGTKDRAYSPEGIVKT